MQLKTLVIHPTDRSTDFLKPIYQGQEDWTIQNDPINPADLVRLIEDHERIIMLGHGSPDGLFRIGLPATSYNYGSFQRDPNIAFLVHHQMAPLLRTKQLVGVWCNANVFFINNRLNGFYTGMIISEPMEAQYMRINSTPEHVRQSNELLAESLRFSIDDQKTMWNVTKTMFEDDNNPVIRYNNGNLFEYYEKPIVNVEKI